MYETTLYSSLFLDSGGGWLGNSNVKNSYIQFSRPEVTFYFDNGLVTINSKEGASKSRCDPLLLLEDFLKKGYIATGYIGYEFSTHTDTGFIPSYAKNDKRLPDLFFLLFRPDQVTMGDWSNLKDETCQATKDAYEHDDLYILSNMSKDDYKDKVRLAKGFIKSGDIYQVNLSQRFTCAAKFIPLSYFLELFHVQHVPYGCYMDFGQFQLISGSMELFLRKNGENIATMPIKGTAKRGISQKEDVMNKTKLLDSKKERAENLMIVDLMRNDLSRICRHGSVKVNQLFSIESYSTLHQMVSEVEGKLKDGTNLRDIIRNVFPPGSVTGAPKKRALEIIDLLEPHYRGPYCGTVGIFYPDGDFTLSVGIRVLVVEQNTARYWAGSGIVWDSDPDEEYEETLLKASAIRKASEITG